MLCCGHMRCPERASAFKRCQPLGGWLIHAVCRCLCATCAHMVATLRVVQRSISQNVCALRRFVFLRHDTNPTAQLCALWVIQSQHLVVSVGLRHHVTPGSVGVAARARLPAASPARNKRAPARGGLSLRPVLALTHVRVRDCGFLHPACWS